MRPSLHDRGPRNHAMASASLSTARAAFGSPPPDARPMVRWWWFGPAQTEEMIQADLNAIASGGWGGVELAVVYPLSIDGEPAPYEYLSPTFLQRVGFAAERAHELGLRFDLTLGGGWSYGGPHIPRELAAKRLCWDVVEVAPQEATWPVAAARAGEHLVAAYWGEGTVEAPPTDWTRLDATPGTPLALPARPGSAVLALAWSVPTGQTVKRAPLGGEGYILDHYSPAAIARHLQVVGEPLLAAAQAGGERRVTAVFCDSLEVQGADWTEDAPGEFARRRGYDLLDVLPSLCERLGRQADQRVRHDLGRTLTELFEERFVRPLRDWAHEHGVLLRLQGYGSPPAAMGSASQVDLIEGESWGWDGVPPGRWAASAAQAVGEQVVSAETWTWIASPSMAATPLDLQAEAVEHLSLGVNHFIGHGWPSSPREIPDPGWLFYAAGALTDRNPWWPLAPDLTTWLARWSAIARLGVPVRDIGVYVPDCLAYGRLSPGSGAASMDLWRSTSGLVPAGLIGHLRAAGYDVAVVDDAALDTAHLRHRVLVAIGGDAAPILHCGVSEVIDASEGDVLARVSAAVGPAALPNVSHAAGVVRVHRALADADLHLLLNVSSHSARVQVPGEGGGWEVWDARDGAMHAVNAGSSL